jgi:type VI secretion system Hcp family effector
MTELRSFNRAMVIVGVALMTAMFSAGESWAFRGVATIDSGGQGQIQGDNTRKGEEGTIFLSAIGVSARRAPDPTTGFPAGKLHSAPFKIFKEPDKATPKLIKALGFNESLTVRIRWFRTLNTGLEQHYFTIELANATIASFEVGGDVTVARGVQEEIVFAYETITFTDVVNGTVATVHWAP